MHRAHGMQKIHGAQKDVEQIRVSGGEELRGRSEIADVEQVAFWCQSRVEYFSDMRMPQSSIPREDINKTRTILREAVVADRLDDNVVPAKNMIRCDKG